MIEDRGTNGTQPLIGRPIESQSGTRWSRVVRWNPTVTWKYNNNNNNNNKTEHDSAPSRRERICGAILWFAVYSLGNLSTCFRKSTSNPIERDRPLLLPRRTSQSTCRKRRAQPIKRDRSRMNRMDRIQIFDIGIFNLFDLRRQALRKWNSFRWKRVEPIEWMKRNGLGRRNFLFLIIFFFEIRRPPGRWPWRVAQLSISASPPSGTGGISGMSGISAEKSTKQKKETTAPFHATFH